MKRGFLAVIFAFALGAYAQEAEAATRHVGVGQTHDTIQKAIDASNTGDVIVVHTGTYTERLVIDGLDTLYIKANGTDVVLIDAPNIYVSAIVADTVEELHLCNIAVEAPNHATPPQRGITVLSNTTQNIEEFSLFLYWVDITGHNLTNNVGVACNAGSNDTINVGAWQGSIQYFNVPIQPTCNTSIPDWPWDDWEDDYPRVCPF